MTNYTEGQIKNAFMNGYLDEHGTIEGANDAYEWWKNPGYKCLIEIKRGEKCTKICETCLLRYANK
jgi:hypothetical protein